MSERDFHRAMLRLYEIAKDELGFNATFFKRMLGEYGGVETAHRLLRSGNPSEGFTTLWERRRLDLSVEAHVLRPEFQDLFTDEEREIAADRLRAYGFTPPQ